MGLCHRPVKILLDQMADYFWLLRQARFDLLRPLLHANLEHSRPKWAARKTKHPFLASVKDRTSAWEARTLLELHLLQVEPVRQGPSWNYIFSTQSQEGKDPSRTTSSPGRTWKARILLELHTFQAESFYIFIFCRQGLESRDASGATSSPGRAWEARTLLQLNVLQAESRKQRPFFSITNQGGKDPSGATPSPSRPWEARTLLEQHSSPSRPWEARTLLQLQGGPF